MNSLNINYITYYSLKKIKRFHMIFFLQTSLHANPNFILNKSDVIKCTSASSTVADGNQ